MDSAKSQKLLVVAIDFGTTFSSWAFAFLHDYQRDPTKIFVKNWNNGVGISCKAPTTALIRPDGKTLEAFGYEAEDKFAKLFEKNEHRDRYFFQRFKMSLYKDKKLTRDTIIFDETGKPMAAIKVISLVIRYMKDDVCKQIKSQMVGELLLNDIKWVLTVPAIWNDKAKQFMREAAKQAGISDAHLLLALEPEAASLYSRQIPLKIEDFDGKSSIVPLSPGTRYIVVDAGGGTVDIMIHEVLEDGNVQEIDMATGGAWGGNEVDEAFIQFLIQIFGTSVMQQFKKEAMDDYIELFRNFELKKRKVDPKRVEEVQFSLPNSLMSIYEEHAGKDLTESLNQTQFAANVHVLKGNKLRLHHLVMRGFFDRSIRNVCDHLQTFHKDRKKFNISVAILVGGFSESPMLSGTIGEKCSSWKVIVLKDASLAVLKGAVLYGFDQSVIVYRVARYTYGISKRVQFIDGVHPLDKLVVYDDGRRQCRNSFHKFLEKGVLVKYDQVVFEHKGAVSIDTNDDEINIQIYASTDKDPKFTTDESCFLLGNLRSNAFEASIDGRKRTVDVTITHKGTDLHLKAVDTQSGRELDTCFDLLE
ncbi:hypothetical protein ACJMK2_031244 [Sinanodonta woodiana]|uniref:Heat shock 70 kDa protein 12A n=1 Tax=Sinanodonta woodiana TaxID=1069815 RepID=A0ABD3X1P1_SINWO